MKFRVEHRTPAHPGNGCGDCGALDQRVIEDEAHEFDGARNPHGRPEPGFSNHARRITAFRFRGRIALPEDRHKLIPFVVGYRFLVEPLPVRPCEVLPHLNCFPGICSRNIEGERKFSKEGGGQAVECKDGKKRMLSAGDGEPELPRVLVVGGAERHHPPDAGGVPGARNREVHDAAGQCERETGLGRCGEGLPSLPCCGRDAREHLLESLITRSAVPGAFREELVLKCRREVVVVDGSRVAADLTFGLGAVEEL